ncbi:glycerophosphodiester phosphodiesterase [Microbispora sp. RL4-1S]|uniref:Glycerophosphodiester phosphodiesterase n=1 Tax=Microbispora oryzae TaxID=2806554 RepID=A0A941AJZ1_9ACTN|nr:glycerophosphodiester phosphodiesterase [Microbispora oryzae]MBP2705537.1 glycerophosphodiester phosphodiesterase [Microbispora oryzae]
MRRLTRASAVPMLALTVAVPASPAESQVVDRARGTCSAPSAVAHRGDGAGYTENTSGAFREVLAGGARQVELDVHFTKDHHPVLMHDSTVDRTTTGTGRVSAMTLGKFRDLRTPDGQRPPTLATVMRLVRDAGARMLVELKEVPDASDLRSLRADYRRLGAYRWASLMSFSPAALHAARAIPADKGLLATSPPSVRVARGYDFVGVRYDRLTAARVRAYRAAGVAVYAWTPNDRADWRRLASYGVSRVVTDRAPAYQMWARTACRP